MNASAENYLYMKMDIDFQQQFNDKEYFIHMQKRFNKASLFSIIKQYMNITTRLVKMLKPKLAMNQPKN